MINLIANLIALLGALIGQVSCEQAVEDADFTHVAGLEMSCITTEYRDLILPESGAVGWFNGDENHIYLLNDQGYQYTTEIISHEVGHAWDLQLGTNFNGYPSFFSETNTDFDVEEFARMYSHYRGMWPANEDLTYHQVIPTQDDYEAMVSAGWLPRQ